MILQLIFVASVLTGGWAGIPSRNSEELSINVKSRFQLTYPEGDHARHALPRLNCQTHDVKEREDSLTGVLVERVPKLEEEYGLRVKISFRDGIMTSCELAPADIMEREECLSPPSIANPGLVCEDGWTLIEDSCFLFSNESGKWSDGHVFCESLGATLAIVSSPVQQAVISTMIEEDTWIGLEDSWYEGYFEWVDGSYLTYTSWAFGQPDNLPGMVFYGEREDCVEIKKSFNFLWNDEQCSDVNKFLCSALAKPAPTTTTTTTTSTTTTTTTTTTTAPPECPEGWEMRDLSCYLASTTKENWESAQASCQGLGAHLVSITSEEEQDFVTGLLESSAWIGLSDLETEGEFKWDDGCELDYFKWEEYEPNNGNMIGFEGNEDCVEMKKRFGYTWNDEDCYLKNIYICEKPAE